MAKTSLWGRIVNAVRGQDVERDRVGVSFSVTGDGKQYVDVGAQLGDPLYGLRDETVTHDYRRRLTRGEFTMPTWALHEAARVLPMLGDKLRWWRASIGALDWGVKTLEGEKLPAGAEAKADAQAKVLKAYYEKANTREAIEHLSLARFYGVAALAKKGTNLEAFDPWMFLRSGTYGGWYYNRNLTVTSTQFLQPADAIDPASWVIRACDDNALLEMLRVYIRATSTEQWWDRNLEQEAKRQVIVLTAASGIANITDYTASATQIARGNSGALAKGSADAPTEIIFPPASRGLPFYEARLRLLDEQLTKAITGGLLTMLTAPGSGTLAGNAHADTARMVVMAEAGKISAVLQEQIDKPLLRAAGLLADGELPLAYFELSGRQEVDADAEVRQTVALSGAGYKRSIDELSERVGMVFDTKPSEQQPAEILRSLYPVIAAGFRPNERAIEKLLGLPVDPMPVVDPNATTPPMGNRAGRSLVPPQAVQSAVRRGLKLYDAGKGGDGLKPETIRRARSIAAGEAQSEPWATKEAPAWFARHTKTRPEGDAAGSPWEVAWLLWGGNAGRDWVGGMANRAGQVADELSIPESWAAPVRDLIEDLIAKAEDEGLTDADLQAALDLAVKRAPELFGDKQVEDFAKIIEAATGAAVVEGARAGMRKE
jgi:hypothetical protein